MPLHVSHWRVAPSSAVAGGVAIVLAGLLLWTAGDAFVPATPVRIVPVVFDASASTQAAQLRGASSPPGQTIQAPGWLEASPYYTAASALADGVIAEVLVLEGQTVERGQPVARLVPDDARIALEAAQAAHEAAQAQVLTAQAERRAAETDWANPIDRERAVAATRAQLAETAAQLEQLPALVEAERATLKRYEAEYARSARAQESGATNELEVIVLEQRVAGQAAILVAMERREGILRAQMDRLSAEAQAAERNFALRIDERRRLDLAIASEQRARADLALATARLADAQLRFERLTIPAPISGAVQRRLKSPGDKVMLSMDDPHSSHVLHLYDPSKIQVRVDVPLADASHMFIGQRCEVVVEVLPDTVFVGVVDRITYEADLQKNTLQAKVRVIDPSPLLRPEMLTRVKFLPAGGDRPEAQTPGAAVLVPIEAIDDGLVWVVRDRRGRVGRAYAQAVEVVQQQGAWAKVRGSLHAGDLLAIGDTELVEGARVRFSADKTKSGGA